MSNDFDFNHDGKVDMQDVHLYEDIFSDESEDSMSRQPGISSRLSGIKLQSFSASKRLQ